MQAALYALLGIAHAAGALAFLADPMGYAANAAMALVAFGLAIRSAYKAP